MFRHQFTGRFVVVMLIMATLAGCARKEKFTRQGWNDGDGLEFPRRNVMLDDLLSSHKLVGLKYKQVTGLLHEPQRHSFTDISFHYEIVRQMSGIDTVYTKDLVFYMNKDSVVTATKVVEKKYKKDKKK